MCIYKLYKQEQKTLNTPNKNPSNLSKYPMDVDLKILSIGIEITLQIINVKIKIDDITTISLKASFSININ